MDCFRTALMFHVFVCMFLLSDILLCSCVNYGDINRLQTDLLKGSKHIKPRINQTEKVNVDILLFVNSIQDYDEVSGNLIFTGSFALYWTDETKAWDPSLFGGIEAIDLPLAETWTPKVLIRNGVDRISVFRFDDELSVEKSSVTYFYNGKAKVVTHGLYHVICQPDVTYYPKDEHECKIIVTTAYLLNDVTLTSTNGIYRKNFLPNPEWFITKDFTVKNVFDVYVTDERKTYQDQIEFTLFVHREYLFPLVNVILPIIILSVTHFLVFLLPVESGERTSFSFTLFLTLVVFMTIVSDRLPPSSNISVFNVFLLQQLLSSVLITALTVFSIRLHHKVTYNRSDGRIYRILLESYKIQCRDCSIKNDNSEDESNTWKNVSLFFDRLCLRTLLIIFVLQLIVYGAIVAFGK